MWKDNFLVLGEGFTQAINGSTGTSEKKLVLILLKQIKKLCLSLHYNDDESCLHVNKTETYEFKTKDNISFSWQHKTLTCLEKNNNIFQTTRFNHTMIFFRLTN